MDWSRLDLDLTFKKGGPAIGFALTSKTCHYICFFFFCFFGWINLFLEWLITCCFLPNRIQQWGSALLKMKFGLQFCVCFLMGRICRFHVVSFTISKCCLPQILPMHSIPNTKCIKLRETLRAVWMHKLHQK